jgi:hypothetical protein
VLAAMLSGAMPEAVHGQRIIEIHPEEDDELIPGAEALRELRNEMMIRAMSWPRNIVAEADPNTPISPGVLEVVSQLDDASYDRREAAAQLLASDEVDNQQLLALLAGDSLSPEQRYRLVEVVETRIIRTPRGAVGIQIDMGMGVGPNGLLELRVNGLVPGLPAEKVLRIGDRISHVDGQPLRAQQDFTTIVQMKKPGEKVTLRVKRNRTDEQGRLLRDAEDQLIVDDMDI